MELRTYQQSSLDNTLGWLKTKITHPLIVLPTGSGKTIVFAHLIKTLYKQDPSQRFLIIAHRQELISQAKEKILNVWPNAPCGILSANLKQFNNTASIIISVPDCIVAGVFLTKLSCMLLSLLQQLILDRFELTNMNLDIGKIQRPANKTSINP